MKRQNKKALYESIMKSVAKTVKNALNESYQNDGLTYMEDALQRLTSYTESEQVPEIKEDLLLVLNSINSILSPILSIDFENNSDEELAILEYTKLMNDLRDML